MVCVARSSKDVYLSPGSPLLGSLSFPHPNSSHHRIHNNLPSSVSFVLSLVIFFIKLSRQTLFGHSFAASSAHFRSIDSTKLATFRPFIQLHDLSTLSRYLVEIYEYSGLSTINSSAFYQTSNPNQFQPSSCLDKTLELSA